jgi:hypothetical protein
VEESKSLSSIQVGNLGSDGKVQAVVAIKRKLVPKTLAPLFSIRKISQTFAMEEVQSDVHTHKVTTLSRLTRSATPDLPIRNFVNKLNPSTTLA